MEYNHIRDRLKQVKDFNGEEKFMWEIFYRKGMENPWLNGSVDFVDGNFLKEEDRLNRKSAVIIQDIDTLRDFFTHGNWSIGTAVIYKKLCFINQVDGGDEWLTMKMFGADAHDFESISFNRIVERKDFPNYIEALEKAELIFEENKKPYVEYKWIGW